MSKYKFSLFDYHAIEKAEIELNGITVLSGINGSGKSTISRWLYYLINGSNRFHDHQMQKYGDEIKMRVSNMFMIRHEFRRDGVLENNTTNHYNLYGKISENKSSSTRDFDELDLYFNAYIDRFCTELTAYLTNAASELRLKRVLSMLDIELEDSKLHNVQKTIEDFNKKEKEKLLHLREEIIAEAEERSLSLFVQSINRFYHEKDFPARIQLSEDGAELLDESFVSSLFHLKRALYIDTPMSIMGGQNIFWNELNELMMDDNVNLNDEQKKLLYRIHENIHGSVKVTEDLFHVPELHYISDSGLKIDLKDVATGFKTFAYLQRLIENGSLTEHTILMIDEPEAHLHPQWIVDFARLLVLLYKNLHVKVLIASHNPDMVAAIQSISRKEEVNEDLHFYIANENEETGKYIYEDLGDEVDKIFQSFNIALDRINNYGEGR